MDFTEYYRFDRAKDGYPEKADLAAYRFRIRAVSIYKNKSEWVACEVDMGEYLTWKIGALSAKADADEGIIRFQWDAAGSFYGDLAFTPLLNGRPVAQDLHVRSYFFTLEGFLEKGDIKKMAFSLSAKTEADSRKLDGIIADTRTYKTYKITPPTVTAMAVYEGLHITWSGKTDDYYLIPRYDVFVDGKLIKKDL